LLASALILLMLPVLIDVFSRRTTPVDLANAQSEVAE
jgi:hypothetical protein